jgi:hypothetical protein
MLFQRNTAGLFTTEKSMLATHDERNRIILGCAELPCAPSTFLPALLALDHDAPSVSDTSLSKALRGNGHLSPEKYSALLNKIAECKELKASAGGIPVAFVSAEIIHGLLMERRRLRREVTAPQQIFSVSIDCYWFVERNTVGQIIQTTFQMMAAKMDRGTAQRVVSELKKRGHEVVEIHANPSGGNGSSFEHLMNFPPVVEVEAVIGEAEPQ